MEQVQENPSTINSSESSTHCDCGEECAHSNTSTRMVGGDLTTYCHDCHMTL